MTEFRARIEADPLQDGIRVWLIEIGADRTRWSINPMDGDHHELAPASAAIEWADLPRLTLPDTAALALLEELAKHYGRATDHGVTRDLLTEERRRVDQLLTTMSRALEAAMSPPVVVDYHGGEQPPTVTGRAPRWASMLPDVTRDGRGTGEWSGRTGG